MCHIHLAISETKRIPEARAFYDTMEETMNVVIRTSGKFYSYIQGEKYSIDLDRRGNILGMEIFAPVKEWKVVSDLMPPDKFELRKIRILEHRKEFEPIGFFTNKKISFCCMRFTEEKVSYYYKAAQDLIFEVNVMDELSAVWALNLVQDFGFKREMKYRKGLNVA
jgi:hypothetical protein